MSMTFSLHEAAEYLGVSYRTMRRYVKKGLPYSEVRGARGIEYHVTKEALLGFTGQLPARPARQERSRTRSVRVLRKAVARKEGDPGTEDIHSSLPPSLETEYLSKKLVVSLEAENSFLREQLLAKDRQLEVKDTQLADYHDIVKRLSHQNEVLTMIAQGIEPMKLLRGGEEHVYQQTAETAVREEPLDLPVTPVEGNKPAALSREEVVVRAKGMHREGRTTQEIREFIQAHGYDSFSDLLRTA